MVKLFSKFGRDEQITEEYQFKNCRGAEQSDIYTNTILYQNMVLNLYPK